MRQHTEAEERKWNRWHGRQVIKTSGKPFKSGLKIGTIAAVGQHQHTSHLAFTMAEDGSQVECFRCELYVEPNDHVTAIHRGMLHDGVDPEALRHMISKHITDLQALSEGFDVDYAIQALGNFNGELAKQQGS